MPRPLNYRTNPFHLFGRDLNIAGMAGPHNNADRDDVFDFLKIADERDVLIGLHESENFTEEAARHGIEYHCIPIIDFAKTPVPAATYDAIYDVVKKATAENKQVAIHCGSGDGRTATALAALKLRELLENAARRDPKILDTDPLSTDDVKPSTEKHPTPCTPLVREAIESIRSQRQAPDNSGIHAVEKDNDVNTLIEYEKHLRRVLKRELELTNDKEKRELIGKVEKAELLRKDLAKLEGSSGNDEALQGVKKNLKAFLDANPSKAEIQAQINRVDGDIARLQARTEELLSKRFLNDRLTEKIALVKELNEPNSAESIATMQKDHQEFLAKEQPIGLRRLYATSLIDDIKVLQTKIQQKPPSDEHIERFMNDRLIEKIGLVKKLNAANSSEAIATIQKDHQEFLSKERSPKFIRQYASLLVDDIKDLQAQIKQSDQMQKTPMHGTHPQGGGVNPAQSMRDQMQTLKNQGTPTATPAVTPQQNTEKAGVTLHVNR